MALPTNSAGPDAPTDSTPIDGALGLGNDDQEIRNWLVALSPPGASAYDTGWVDIALNANFVAGPGAAPQVRRIGKTVYYRGQIAVKTGTFAPGVELVLGTIPAGFRQPRSWADGYVPLWMNPTIHVPGRGASYPNGNLVFTVPTGTTLATTVQIQPLGPHQVD